MPLAQPLDVLRRDLQTLLIEDLAGALKTLHGLLPEGSEKHATVVLLLGRLNDANKARLRNTLSNEDLQREYDTLRADFHDLVIGLTDADFDATAPKAHAAGKPAAKSGSVLYRIPDVMPLRRETKCVVRVAVQEDAIVQDIQLDEHIVLKALARVSDLMQVQLADPSAESVFKIRSTSPPEQIVYDDGYTEWFFYVEPLREGSWPLEVKVAVIELVLNRECKKEFVLSETVQIITEEPAADALAEAPLKPAGYALSFHTADTTSVPAVLSPAPAMSPPARPPGGGSGTKSGSLVPPAVLSDSAPTQSMPQAPPPPPPARRSGKGLRTAALFLAFLVLGSGTIWAVPADQRDWLVTRYVKDTPDAYDAFVQKHGASRYVESALYWKAMASERVEDFRAYQQRYRDGRFQNQVLERLNALEIKYLQDLQQNPTVERMRQYLTHFPHSERLSQVKQVVETRPEWRAELLPALEQAYVEALRANPTANQVRRYLADFPAGERLDEMKLIVDQQPALRREVQADLEAIYLQQIKDDPTPAAVRNFLAEFPMPLRQHELDTLVRKFPQLRRWRR